MGKKGLKGPYLTDFQGPVPGGAFQVFTEAYESFRGNDGLDLLRISEHVFRVIPHVFIREFTTNDGYRWAGVFFFVVEGVTFCLFIPHRKEVKKRLKVERPVIGYYRGPWKENHFPQLLGAIHGAMLDFLSDD